MFQKYFTLVLLMGTSFFITAQQVTTLVQNSSIDDGLVADDKGGIYGSRYQGSAVYHWTPGSTSTTNFSDGYNTPNGLAIDHNGVLYMADNIGNKIYRLLEDGSHEIFVNNLINVSGLLFEHDSDTLIATSYDGDRILKIAPDGGQVLLTSGNLLEGPVGLCYDDQYRLYVGNFNDRKIIRLEDNGDQVLIAQAPGSGPLGFITYAKGYIYGTLFNDNKIYRTDLSGEGSIILGSSSASTVDGGPDVARFNGPNGITASPSQDTLYVSEFNSSALRMITDLETLTSTKAIDPALAVQWQITPNPAASETRVELSVARSAKLSLTLFDHSGKQLFQIYAKRLLGSGDHIIPLSLDHLPAGTYHIQLELEDAAPLSKVFIKS